MTEMTRVTGLYLRIKEYSQRLTNGYEEVFYNADRDLNYQTMLIISAVRNDDPEDIVIKKIKMVSKFVDDFASIRLFNYRKVNWNTNKYLLFRVMRDIRNQDCATVGKVLVRELRRMDVTIDGITRFSLNQFTGRYMLHFLARFTSFMNICMGNPSQFDTYIDRKAKGNTYDIEHILPDRFEDYADDFDTPDEFQTWRQHIGNLIILTRDKNRSYQDKKYQAKVVSYAGDNILAQALNPTAYHNNPQFMKLAKKYGFSDISHFTKESITNRAEIYLKMAIDIWDPMDIKSLAGGWTDEEEVEFAKDSRHQVFTVEFADRSWQDALKYGFLSADETNSGKLLRNIHVGDTIYCHIAGCGFVGIGICTSKAIYMDDFDVIVDGNSMPITKLTWVNPELKDKLDPKKELFIGVEWKAAVADTSQGFWEKGMVSLPLVAYMLNDRKTHRKVADHFGYDPES